MIKAGVGRSNNPDPIKAGAEAAKQALTQIGNKANLIIVFSTISYDIVAIQKTLGKYAFNRFLFLRRTSSNWGKNWEPLCVSQRNRGFAGIGRIKK